MKFNEILLMITILSGFVWVLDLIFWRSKRLASAIKEGQSPKEPLVVEYCRAFFPVLLIVVVLRLFLAEPFRIPSGSMRPTLLEGDFILVNKYEYGLRTPFFGQTLINIGKPQRGEVIVFEHIKEGKSMDMIKRVIGLPGDRVQYKNKIIYVNGEPLKQTFVSEEIDKNPEEKTGWLVRRQVETIGPIQHDIFLQMGTERSPHPFQDIVVPANSYFVMGDNRDNSADSRSWGFVKEEDILGRAMGIWMSWDWDSSREGWDRLIHCIRFGRIGMGLNKQSSP